jgi:hypothetical protein
MILLFVSYSSSTDKEVEPPVLVEKKGVQSGVSNSVGGGDAHSLLCADGKIMGLNVRTGSLVDNVQVVYATQQ